MFELFFAGIQQDLKLAILPPIVCAIFRYIFIKIYGPGYSWIQDGKKLWTCFNYGFWWGMDFNAYVYLISLVLVSLPATFISSYYAVGDTVRIAGLMLYMTVLYIAFVGRMIFYYHFHDIYNQTVRLGKNADKMNFLDIFFNQNHGALVLFGFIPYWAVCAGAAYGFLQLPSLPLPSVGNDWGQYVLNIIIFLLAIVLYYFFRFGGTLKHRNKPEWDEVPVIVKEDIFLGKATVDDLIILEKIFRTPVQTILGHSDEESLEIMKGLPALAISVEAYEKQRAADSMATFNPLEAFKRVAKGPRIKRPRHIFFIVGESYMQAPMDDAFAELHISDRGKAFRQEEHSITFDYFLAAGMISQPSITSLMAGIFDNNLELNEMENFWRKTLPTALPMQLKKLGYRTDLWYGGALNWASLGLFSAGNGFDAAYGGPDICSDDAPRTWLGIYDHIFLEEVFKRICEYDTGEACAHFIYTTSNHSPYTLPLAEYGWDPQRIMPKAPEWLRKDQDKLADLGTYWYTDASIFDFVDRVRATYPDSLIIVTGDHSRHIPLIGKDLNDDKDMTLQQYYSTAFTMHHPELTQDMVGANRLAGHMNILPTLIEAIAPKGTEYYSLMPSLFEPIDHVVTPYHWVDSHKMGLYEQGTAQRLMGTEDSPIELETREYEAERDAYMEVTGWIVRHPELMSIVNEYN